MQFDAVQNIAAVQTTLHHAVQNDNAAVQNSIVSSSSCYSERWELSHRCTVSTLYTFTSIPHTQTHITRHNTTLTGLSPSAPSPWTHIDSIKLQAKQTSPLDKTTHERKPIKILRAVRAKVSQRSSHRQSCRVSSSYRPNSQRETDCSDSRQRPAEENPPPFLTTFSPPPLRLSRACLDKYSNRSFLK